MIGAWAYSQLRRLSALGETVSRTEPYGDATAILEHGYMNLRCQSSQPPMSEEDRSTGRIAELGVLLIAVIALAATILG